MKAGKTVFIMRNGHPIDNYLAARNKREVSLHSSFIVFLHVFLKWVGRVSEKESASEENVYVIFLSSFPNIGVRIAESRIISGRREWGWGG